MRGMIDFYPNKAQYRAGESVQLLFEHDGCYTGCVAELRLYHLNHEIMQLTVIVETDPCVVTISPFDTQYSAYGAQLAVTTTDGVAFWTTAFDVTKTPGYPIRYGFLSDFGEKSHGADDVETMARYHINTVQFYDWSWRHDKLVADTTEYTDMMGRSVNLSVVKEKISACHQYGMAALGYGAVYAASLPFYQKHPEWGLYTTARDPLTFIDIFYIMNIAANCPWREHIITQYRQAVSKLGFDGIHMDTYGFPKTALNYEGQTVRLAEHFGSLIEDTRHALESLGKIFLIFNNVGNWPVHSVARTPQDAIYIEVWEPYTRYAHLRQIILEAKRSCKNQKTVVLAAYLAPFREDTPERALNAARLLLAATAANGAINLLLGEKNAVLTQGYYVDHSILEDAHAAILRRYYDFIVRYGELLFNPILEDVSFTHIGGDNAEYQCIDCSWSPDGQPDTIWLTIRESIDCKTINMINLLGVDDAWNVGKANPTPCHDIHLRILVDREPTSVWTASPDDGGKAIPVSYVFEKSERGFVVSITIATLDCWRMLTVTLA